MHYSSEEAAAKKREERKKRINREKLYIIGSDKDFCDKDVIDRFVKLPFSNKVFFSSKPHQAKEVIYLPQYRNQKEIGDLIKDGKSWYFFFDVGHWLETGELRKTRLAALYFRFYFYLKQLLNSINN